jgi:diaminopimelate epimerase
VKNAFYKGHGLGNDYIVVDPEELEFKLTPARVRKLCDRHEGIGSDGVLVLVPSKRARFGLRIFNPDGSGAEKSGNGLRIFARFLYATRRTRATRFDVETPGGIVQMDLDLDAHGEAHHVTVAMGSASFRPADLPCTLPVEELLDESLRVGSRAIRFTGVSVGNPHCVVFRAADRPWSDRDLHTLGPALETHRVFPRFTNVQLAVPTGPRELTILIWERGAGVTQASGSSASAAAAAAVRLGLVRSPVTVKMPGGALRVGIGEGFEVTLDGPVAEVARGQLAPEFVRSLSR